MPAATRLRASAAPSRSRAVTTSSRTARRSTSGPSLGPRTRVAAMTAPRPNGYRLAVIYGYSLPAGAHPVEGERVSVEAGGARPVEAVDGGELGGVPRHGVDRSVPARQPADFLLLRGSSPKLSAGDLDADLVYAAAGAVVDTTVVAGRVLMRDRVVPGAEELVAEVRARAARLTA